MTDVSSRQVSWWSVHTFVELQLSTVESWPAAGTPAWCQLEDDDPRKRAAVLAAGVRWALHIDTIQEQLAEASREIAAMENWSSLSRRMRSRNGVHIPRRAAS